MIYMWKIRRFQPNIQDVAVPNRKRINMVETNVERQGWLFDEGKPNHYPECSAK
jgi:hypothetical protein